MYCLQCFSLEEILNNRKENYIELNGAQAIDMLPENSMMKYENTTGAVCYIC